MAFTNRNSYAAQFPMSRTAGAQASQAQGPNQDGQRVPFVKAEYWLNIGYVTVMTGMVDGELIEEERFISLPQGIPLDMTSKDKPERGDSMRALTRNAGLELRNDFLEAAMQLAPGETVILPGDIGDVRFQLRRAKAEEEVVAPEANAARKRVSLFAAA